MINNIYGEYVVYKNGKEVARQKNAISNAGKITALRTLIGYSQRFANSMAIGISNSPNIFDANSKFIINKTMGMEVARYPINSAFVDTSEQYSKIIFRASSGSDNLRYLIKELGLFFASPDTTSDSKVLMGFGGSETNTTPYSATLIDSPSSSISYGTNAYNIQRTGSLVYVPSPAINVGAVNNTDIINFAYTKQITFNSSITVGFYSGTSSILYEFTNTGSGNIFDSKTIDQNISGSLTSSQWRNITKIEIKNTSAVGADRSIIVDLLRFDEDPDIYLYDTNILSRVVLSTPIEKKENEAIDIEYYLSLGFNEAI